MSEEQPNNPLHGITLKTIVEELVERHGWWELSERVKIRCFSHDPSIKSSLKFLRRTPWARAEVEALYVADQQKTLRNRKRNQRRAAMRAHRAEQEAAGADEQGAQNADPAADPAELPPGEPGPTAS